MKILFFNPLQIYRRWPIPSDYIRFIADVPSLTYPQLAACISEYQCKIFDGLIDHDIKKGFSKIRNADIIAMSVPTEIASLNTELNIRIIKRINPAAKIIVGGYAVKEYDLEWIQKGADFVVRGEGELTFKELIESVDNNSSINRLKRIKGLSFKNDSKIIRNRERQLIKNLDSLPIPKWEILDLKQYRFPLGNDKKFTACIETSRGCVKNCTFCSISPFWGYRQRYKSAKRVVEELSVMHELNIGNFFIADNNCWQNYNRDSSICKSIISERMDLRFGSFARVDNIIEKPDLFALYSKAGLVYVMVGFESLKPKVLSLFNKSEGTTAYNTYKKVYGILRKNSILTVGLFVVGYPGETFDDAKFTFENCYSVCDFPLFNIFIPSKGTYAVNQFPSSLLKKDMFYHDTQACSLYGQEKVARRGRRHVWDNTFNIPRLMKIFDSSILKRKFFRSMYRHILSFGLNNFSLNSFDDFTKMIKYSIQNGEEYQQFLKKKYLESDFVDRIIKKGVK